MEFFSNRNRREARRFIQSVRVTRSHTHRIVSAAGWRLNRTAHVPLIRRERK